MRPLIPLVSVLIAGGCTPGINYSGLEGPRYAGGPGVEPAGAPAAPSLRVVTFNVRYGEEIDSAIALLRGTPELRGADVIALQEVDAAGTARIAHSLAMRWVYYPATLHPKFDRDFGNAVLTRWPIVADRKLILPHLGRFRRTARTATAATILVAGQPLRIYSAHLGTVAEIGPAAKREQARAILADAGPHPRVVVLGDMNSYAIGNAFEEAGYAWATEENPRTFAIGRWDHIFLKGVSLAGARATGVIPETRGASDHRPVWAVIAAHAVR